MNLSPQHWKTAKFHLLKRLYNLLFSSFFAQLQILTNVLGVDYIFFWGPLSLWFCNARPVHCQSSVFFVFVFFFMFFSVPLGSHLDYQPFIMSGFLSDHRDKQVWEDHQSQCVTPSSTSTSHLLFSCTSPCLHSWQIFIPQTHMNGSSSLWFYKVFAQSFCSFRIQSWKPNMHLRLLKFHFCYSNSEVVKSSARFFVSRSDLLSEHSP